jgi:microcystin-dependent protein
MSDCFLGEIRLFAGYKIPAGWVACDGRSLSVQTYQALYSLIGNTYGGNSQNFNLPDLRSRLPIGQGNGLNLTPRTLAQTGGTPTVEVTDAQMPAHNHPLIVSNAPATIESPSGALYASFPNNFPATLNGMYTTNTSGAQQTFDHAMLSSTGGNQDHENVMLTFGINYMMATAGQYPPRPSEEATNG